MSCMPRNQGDGNRWMVLAAVLVSTLLMPVMATSQPQPVTPPPPPEPQCTSTSTSLLAIRELSNTFRKSGSLDDARTEDGCFYVIDHLADTQPGQGVFSYGIELDFEIAIPPGGAQELLFPQRFRHTGGRIWAEFWLRTTSGGWVSLEKREASGGSFDWTPMTSTPSLFYQSGPVQPGHELVTARVTLYNGNPDPTTVEPCDETHWDEGGGFAR